MVKAQVHFEVFARRAGGRSFNLELATENRDVALDAAEQMFTEGGFNAVKVTKETLDPDSGEFNSVAIFSKGDMARPRAKIDDEDRAPPCVSPADLYNVHSRDRIARLLEGWLNRNRATPFELLHRPDLIEKLEASGNELQHAVQKIAVPESQASGASVHEVIRKLQQLIGRAIERVMADHRKGALPRVDADGFAALCVRLVGDPERHYQLGAAIAGHISPAMSWSEKVNLLLDLADKAPPSGPGRGLAFHVLEQPLGEILRSRVGLADLLQADIDLGGHLAALARLAAADAVEALATADPWIGEYIPELSGTAQRLAAWLDGGPHFEGVQVAISKRILAELTSLRRLRPTDAHGEIDIMRALAMALTAASGRLLPLDEVREAFIERSKMLVTGDFVSVYLKDQPSAAKEAQDLVWLLENVTGGTNKRQAMRWLLTTIASLRFESEMSSPAEPAPARLTRLAELHRQVARSGAGAAGLEAALEKIGEMGGRIEDQAKLTSLIVRASAPMPQRVAALVKMACGETAPPGPAADRARIAALRMAKDPAARADLASAPEVLSQLKSLMHMATAA
jgi:hypothetical protein